MLVLIFIYHNPCIRKDADLSSSLVREEMRAGSCFEAIPDIGAAQPLSLKYSDLRA